MLTIMAGLLISLLVLVGVLLFVSPGTPRPFLDDCGMPLAGSISEKITVNINGVELAASPATGAVDMALVVT